MDPHEDTEIAALIKTQAKYHEAPPHLRDRISAALKQAKPADAPPRKNRWSAWQQGWGWSVAFAAGAILSIAITFFYGVPGQQERLMAQVIDGHVRSLMVAHLADVTSSDQHTVKPWFSGKLDFSPPVRDFSEAGFQLVGGRLDYIGGRPVAALVYQHRQHTINVFVWPRDARAPSPPPAAESQGFNIIGEESKAMQFWLVSDLNAGDLKLLAEQLRVADAAPPTVKDRQTP